jgi:hypothetical protein
MGRHLKPLTVHFAQQGCPARVGAQWILCRLDVKIDSHIIPVINCLLKLVEGFLDFSQKKNDSVGRSWYVCPLARISHRAS